MPRSISRRLKQQRRKTPADYHALARQRGFRWLGPQVPNTDSKTGWQCPQDHQWRTPYNTIQQQHGCPVCAGKARKTPADYWAMAKQRGFHWLGPPVAYTKSKTGWRCSKGHEWQTPYSTISRGHGCPKCAGTMRKTEADYQALARKRGFRWLGPLTITQANTGWRCPKGHRWQATYASVAQGTGCPFCYGNAPKMPADYHTLARKRGFRWLGPEVPNIETKTGWACKRGHEWQATFHSLRYGRGCPICAGNRRKTPADYRALARQRGFRWLGPQVNNNTTKTGWACAKGHRWQTTYSCIQVGKGCPTCRWNNVRKLPADYRALARSRGFRWLGPEVPTVDTKTKWRCSLDHEWRAPYNYLQRGHGCPECARPSDTRRKSVTRRLPVRRLRTR